MPQLLGQLKTLVREIDDCGSCSPSMDCCPPSQCCPSCEVPFAQVCFTCPPCGPLPTCPCPVKPLQMPCLPGPGPTCKELAAIAQEELDSRYANFYNYYYVDCRRGTTFPPKRKVRPCCTAEKVAGVTLNGKSPCCGCIRPVCEPEPPKMSGCPTGFKPCKMRLCPPPCCNPIGVWHAQLKPCPPGYKSKPPKPRRRDGCCA